MINEGLFGFPLMSEVHIESKMNTLCVPGSDQENTGPQQPESTFFYVIKLYKC